MKGFKWVINCADGGTLIVNQTDVQRVLDRRGSWEKPQIVYEVKDCGIVKRLWPEDIKNCYQVPL